MKDKGIQPGLLRAPVVGSGASYRTGITGWYLRRNRSLGVDTDGNFYFWHSALAPPAGKFAINFGRMIDPDIDKNVDLHTVQDLTLSYTFYASANKGS